MNQKTGAQKLVQRLTIRRANYKSVKRLDYDENILPLRGNKKLGPHNAERGRGRASHVMIDESNGPKKENTRPLGLSSSVWIPRCEMY